MLGGYLQIEKIRDRLDVVTVAALEAGYGAVQHLLDYGARHRLETFRVLSGQVLPLCFVLGLRRIR